MRRNRARRWSRQYRQDLRARPADECVGPVIVEGDAAAAIFGTLLPPTIVGRKQVLTDNPVSQESDRDLPILNGRVLPSSFTVTDNPDPATLDDEGVSPVS